MDHIAVVVVTYNRRALLLECLSALLAQSRAPTRIHVIDNASTDGTRDALQVGGWLQRSEIDYLCLPTTSVAPAVSPRASSVPSRRALIGCG